MSEYKQEVRELFEPPAPEHDDDLYCHVEELKPKKRRKKTDPRTFQLTWIPWEDLNCTELIQLGYYNRARDIESEAAICRVMCRTLTRETLMRIILGTEDLTELPDAPVHKERDAIVGWQQENWKYIYSQLHCSLDCAGCSDVCVMACYTENAHQFEERG